MTQRNGKCVVGIPPTETPISEQAGLLAQMLEPASADIQVSLPQLQIIKAIAKVMLLRAAKLSSF